MRITKPAFIGILLIALGIGTGLGVVLSRQSNTSSPMKATPTPANAIRSDWKTYTNDLYGYTIKFPKNWVPVEHASNVQNVDSWKAPDGSTIQILVTELESSLTLDQYLERLDQTNSTGWEGKPAVNVIHVKRGLTVGSEPAVQRTEDMLAAGFTTTSTYVKNGKYVYSLRILPGGEGNISNSQAAAQYDATLASFLFPVVTPTEAESVEGGYYTGEISSRVPYKGLQFKDIDIHRFQPLEAELSKTDFHFGDAVFDGYTFVATKGEDFEFIAFEDRASNPGSFIDTELYGYGPTVIKMDTTIGWGVPANGRYFYVVKGRDFYGSHFVVPDGSGRSYDGSKYGKYTLNITQRK